MTLPPLDFYLVPHSSGLPPLQDEWLHCAERELDVKLPRDLVQLLRVQNGGQLRYNSHAARINGRDHVGVHSLRGIGPSERDGLRRNQYYLDEWELPLELVLLDGNGHEWIALDYRGSTREPSVCWVEADTRRTEMLAPTFNSFLAGLLRGDHWVCFGFAQPVLPVLDQLATIFGLEFRESRLVAGTFEGRHPTWRDECDEPAEFVVEPNDPSFASGFPEHPDRATIVRVDVRVEHRSVLATTMAALDLSPRLVHSPPWSQD